jgi:hypothetical protein
VDGDLLIGFRVHEDMEVAVLIQIGELLTLDLHGLQAFVGSKASFQDGAGGENSELDVFDAAHLTSAHVKLRRGHLAELAFIPEHHTGFEIGR